MEGRNGMKNVVGSSDCMLPLFQFLQNQAHLKVEVGDFQPPL